MILWEGIESNIGIVLKVKTASDKDLKLSSCHATPQSIYGTSLLHYRPSCELYISFSCFRGSSKWNSQIESSSCVLINDLANVYQTCKYLTITLFQFFASEFFGCCSFFSLRNLFFSYNNYIPFILFFVFSTNILTLPKLFSRKTNFIFIISTLHLYILNSSIHYF